MAGTLIDPLASPALQCPPEVLIGLIVEMLRVGLALGMNKITNSKLINVTHRTRQTSKGVWMPSMCLRHA